MKKYTYFIVLSIFCITYTLNAQEKLKGNKNVTIENRDISEFLQIEVIDNIDVLLVYNEEQSVSVETDSNLQEAVVTEVRNNVLTLKVNRKIVRKKALTVHLKVNKNLKEIFAYNSANVKSNNLLLVDSLTINAFDNATFDLKLNTKTVHINGKKTSTLKLEILSDITFINAEEYCRLKTTIDTKNIAITILNKAILSINGTTNNLEIESFGNSSFKGMEFVSTKAIVNVTNSSNVYINTTEAIEIFAKNSADVYLYSNPKITLTEFFDKAILHKREMRNNFFQ